MKTILLPVSILATVSVLQAQTLEEGKKQVYYENYGRGTTILTSVVQQQPANAEAWFQLTNAYMLQKQGDKAAAALQAAPLSLESEPLFQVARGYVLLDRGKRDSAALYFNNAARQTKEKAPEVLSAIAQAEINSKDGDANDAVERLTKAIKRDKHNAALYTLLGDAYRKMNNGTEAYKAYQKAVEENSGYAYAYHRIGEIFLTQKNAELFLEYFNKAVAADPDYAPSLYQLYVYNFYHEPAKAMEYYQMYAAKAEPSIKNEYDLTDLLYLTKAYDKAIEKGSALINKEGANVKPRIYKLLAYSYAELKDTAGALTAMQHYFSKENDTNYVARDFETMAYLYAAASGRTDSALAYFEKAVSLEKDSTALYTYYRKAADLAKGAKDYVNQSKWLGRYYTGNDNATNVDLFNWGLAAFLAQDYATADTVFGKYVAKYPDQTFGYYWQARSAAALDKDMSAGTAIPYYQKLVEVMNSHPADPNYKKWLVESYGYLAAYQANTEKDYTEAKDLFEKVLDVDPQNEDARKYIAILDKK